MKMIVCDLDGTLLNKDREVSENTIKYLNKLKNDGYIITIATGRIFASALKATDGAKFANYIVSDTGACIYDTKNEDIVFKSSIAKEIAEKFINYYTKECKYIDFCDMNTIYKYSDEQENSDLVKTIKDKKLLFESCKDVSHITIAMKNNELVFDLYNRLLNDVPELDITIMQDSFSERKWVEMMPKGCTKYSSITILANILNITNEDIIAFGDGLNDIEMLEKCRIWCCIKKCFTTS